jgi:hypothetical protein
MFHDLMLIRTIIVSIIATIVGALIGMVVIGSFIAGPLGPLLALYLASHSLIPLIIACLCAAPVTVIALPVATHLRWGDGRRIEQLYTFGLGASLPVAVAEAMYLTGFGWERHYLYGLIACVSASFLGGFACGGIFQIAFRPPPKIENAEPGPHITRP